MGNVVFTCLFMLMGQHGNICVKQDGTIEITGEITKDESSVAFWNQIAADWPRLKSLCEFAK
jgi:hypothetical protein